MYLNNRYHDPTLGTFISVDPWVTTTWEPYTYANANPATLSDPTGLAPGINQAIDGGTGRIKPIDIWARTVLPPGVPWWVPVEVHDEARADPELVEELAILDDFLTMPLEEFEARWLEAEGDREWDWTNNGCSDGGRVTGDHFGCVRHDFLYRNQKRIDAEFGLDGQLQSNNGTFKNAVDQRLDDDIGGLPGWLTDFGLSLPWPLNGGADAFYGPGSWVQPPPGRSVYGVDPSAVLPSNHMVGVF